jgi:UPF0755 protein
VVRRALVGLCGALIAIVAAGCGGGGSAPTTTIKQLRQFRVLYPEGFTRAQMIARTQAVAKIAVSESHRKVKLSGAAYAAATAKPRTISGFGSKKLPLEGFLFPDTYNFDRKSTSAQLVSAQLHEFTASWRSLNLSYAKSKNLSAYDVLTIASMIEKEAVAPPDRAKVARVIYNRLHLGMTLGIDATIRYALHIPGTKSLTQSDLANPTPYNTRLHDGLPPTPINNPGMAALEAAAHPAKVDYLYFVRKPDHKHHYFTANYQDFLNHEAQYGY